MGDRWYGQQLGKLGYRRAKGVSDKKKRVLKKDVIAELNKELGAEVSNLDRLTIVTLNELIDAVKKVKNGS